MQIIEKEGYRIETQRADGERPMRIAIVVADERPESLERATATYERMLAAYLYSDIDVAVCLFEYGVLPS